MVELTISGHPGSGTSTLVELISKITGWESVNGGQIFREEAESRGLALADFAALCTENRDIDALLDHRLQELIAAEDGPQIVESRLAGHWAAGTDDRIERIWLHVDLAERARRVCEREGGDIEQRASEIVARSMRDETRYSEYYGISLDDMSPYTMVLDSTSLTAEQTCERVLADIGIGVERDD